LLLLGLVAAVALLPVYPQTPQDGAHMCLARSLALGSLSADECLSDAFDRASYGGHLYSDKAPGLALLEVPAVAAFRLQPSPPAWTPFDLRVWGTRVLTVGFCFLVCAFLVGRVAEGLAPGYGGATLVAFALGTLVGPLAATGFDHVPAALFAFGAFLLAWRGRPFLAGLAGGFAVLVNYEAALAAGVVGVYVLARGLRPFGRYVAGAVPAVALLGAYDWAAFGAPWHLSYRYVDNMFASDQASGFFGISRPHLVQTFEVFAGPDGLLVASPILVLAAVGLYLIRREHPGEVAVCAVVTALFVVLDSGYYTPYGGVSPGPRFLVPALPFLAVGLGPAFRRAPTLSSLTAVVSVATTTAVMLVWSANVPMRATVWGELVRVPSERSHSRYAQAITPNLLHVLGPGRAWGATFAALAGVAALATGLASIPWPQVRAATRSRLPSKAALGIALCLAYAIAAADVAAAFGYPYGNRTAGTAIAVADIGTSISSSPERAQVGSDVQLAVTVAYKGNDVANQLFLTIGLSPGLAVDSGFGYSIGAGCSGVSTIVCNLDYLPAGHATTVYFTARATASGTQHITASVKSGGIPGYDHPTLAIPVS
jgi:hypothetical protein